MTYMPTAGAHPAQPLRPRDLFDEAADGAAVSLSMKVSRVIPRTTTAGIPWALFDGVWRGHQLRCVLFPTVWATVENAQSGDVAVIQGILSRRDGRAVVMVLDLTRMSPTRP